jgi:hypothetical protein
VGLSRPRTAVYVGLRRVGSVLCHHLAFAQDNVDWQIWIAAEGPPLPMKIVIDFKTRASRPQYSVVLSQWDLAAQFKPAEFQFTPPPKAQKIDFLPNKGGAK